MRLDHSADVDNRIQRECQRLEAWRPEDVIWQSTAPCEVGELRLLGMSPLHGVRHTSEQCCLAPTDCGCLKSCLFRSPEMPSLSQNKETSSRLSATCVVSMPGFFCRRPKPSRHGGDNQRHGNRSSHRNWQLHSITQRGIGRRDAEIAQPDGGEETPPAN